MKKLLALLVVPLLVVLGTAQAEAAGRLDATFGKGGKLLLPNRLGPGHETAVLPDGRIVLGGPRIMLALLPSGRIDSGFGRGGSTRFLTPPGHSYATVNDLAVDSQGRLIVAGSAPSPEGDFGTEALVARYGPDGRLDPSFGTNGFFLSDFGFPPVEPRDLGRLFADSVALDASDRIVLTGERQKGWKMIRVGPRAVYDPFVARLTAEGALDHSFAGAGTRRLGKFRGVGGPALEGGGIYLPVFARREALVHLQENGAANPWFGDKGRRPVPAGTEAHTLTLDDAGRLLLFGYLRGSGERGPANGVLVKRLHPDGSPDLSFGRNGSSSLRLPGLDSAAIAPRPGGAVFVAAAVARRKRPGQGALPPGMALARLRPNGRLDRSFGRNGVVTVRFDRGTKTSVHTLLVYESKALIAGTRCAPGGCKRVLARVDL